jgi:hypothetical protein
LQEKSDSTSQDSFFVRREGRFSVPAYDTDSDERSGSQDFIVHELLQTTGVSMIEAPDNAGEFPR